MFHRDIELPAFFPARGLRDPHLMTVAGAFLPRSGVRSFSAMAEMRTFRVDESNAVRAACHWNGRPEDAACVVLVHGLAGDADSPYVLGGASKAIAAGFHAVRVNIRNCGGTADLSSTIYHGGLTAEILAVARELVERDGVPEIHLAGFSMGGSQVLKLAGELGQGAPDWLRSVGAVSPAVDFGAAADCLDGPSFWSRVYRRRFLVNLRDMAQARERLDGGDLQPEALDRIDGIRAFDVAYTAPRGGFRDVEDYYARASSIGWIASIRVPTLILAAEDDPLVPFDGFRPGRFPENPWVRLVTTPEGGHLGFVARTRARTEPGRDADTRWAENRLIQFFAAGRAWGDRAERNTGAKATLLG